MRNLLLNNVALALVVAAVAAPLGNASPPKSGTFYDGYKSGYPQLHAILSAHVRVPATPPGSGTFYDGYKSGYPQLHAILSAHVTSVPRGGFNWRDASLGAGTAAGVIVLLATGALLFVRRRTTLPV